MPDNTKVTVLIFDATQGNAFVASDYMHFGIGYADPQYAEPY
jgi:hypothetical protein